MRVHGLAAGAMAVAALWAAPREAQAGTRFGVEILVSQGYGFGYGHGNEAYRAGYDRGSRDGFEYGARDGDHRRDFDFDHDKRYRCADAGYRGNFGPKAYYQTGYRRGYELAYRQAYASRWRDRDGHYGRRWDGDHRDSDRWLDRGYEHRDRDRGDRDWDDR
jgi:hypothetical protein